MTPSETPELEVWLCPVTDVVLREMHPRYQNHMIPSRAIIVIMGLKECRERGRREFWHDLLCFWKKGDK